MPMVQARDVNWPGIKGLIGDESLGYLYYEECTMHQGVLDFLQPVCMKAVVWVCK